MILEKRHKYIYHISEPLYQALTQLKPQMKPDGKVKVHSLGTPLGLFVKDNFLMGVELVQELVQVTNHRVEVTPQGEQFFLYGKNLQRRSITTIPEFLSQGAKVVVQNERKEALGIGELLEAGDDLKNRAQKIEVVKHLTDLGTRYLRKGA